MLSVPGPAHPAGAANGVLHGGDRALPHPASMQGIFPTPASEFVRDLVARLLHAGTAPLDRCAVELWVGIRDYRNPAAACRKTLWCPSASLQCRCLQAPGNIALDSVSFAVASLAAAPLHGMVREVMSDIIVMKG